ncbi:MAG: hypothetical protein JWQ95_3079 [Sphaerisporangium sp.]|jgi:anti-anti-sigma factor|nr:hypothetical protein [Sphaerisporangium sp.]
MNDTNGATCALVYDDGMLRITSMVHPPGIRLEGELDCSGVPGLMTALAGAVQMPALGNGRIYADLSGLDFIDVGGLRALVTVGLDAGLGGAGVVQVVAASAVARRLLQLTGWDRLPGWDQVPALCLDERQPDAAEHGHVLVAKDAGAVDGGG